MAFSRMDLTVSIAAAAALGGWFIMSFSVSHSGERGRIARCAGNLKKLGEAMQSYASEHEGGIPATGINLEKMKMSWDTELFPYLKPNLAKSNGAYEKRQLMLAVKGFFFCPSDPVPRGGTPRSYAMSGRDMMFGWPPSPNDATGVGLWWDTRTTGVLGDKAKQLKDSESLPQFELAMLPAPADTLLLTELIDSNNVVGKLLGTRVFGIAQQKAGWEADSPAFHFGKFNYLMADGHVELLTELQTGGIGKQPAGIWTIKAGD